MPVKSKSARVKLGPAQLQAVAELFAVLSETSRLRILQVLHDHPASVGDIVSATGMKQANVSKQLGIMRRAGVLAREQRGNVARYSIRLPLVFKLCHVVCTTLQDQAKSKAKLLR